ncbi:MAG: hypothetical protein GF411_06085 [Candidatus Lokiarchaeota archaeon]|nr:hypothetical protein [Candidatus Lokiarchaeota archaeon]
MIQEMADRIVRGNLRRWKYNTNTVERCAESQRTQQLLKVGAGNQLKVRLSPFSIPRDLSKEGDLT